MYIYYIRKRRFVKGHFACKPKIYGFHTVSQAPQNAGFCFQSAKRRSTGIDSGVCPRRFASEKSEKTKTQGKNGQGRIQNAQSPTGIFKGLLNASFFNSPILFIFAEAGCVRSTGSVLRIVPSRNPEQRICSLPGGSQLKTRYRTYPVFVRMPHSYLLFFRAHLLKHSGLLPAFLFRLCAVTEDQ